MELVADPETNLLVIGPHPSDNRDVFHWFEMCDAVQAEKYEIDGVVVSNFLLPLYFTGTRDVDEPGARNDFLGRSYGGQTLRSFGINPGGYIGFFDPQTGEHETFSIRGDSVAAMRLAMKQRAKETRRSVRYRDEKVRDKLREMSEANGRPGKARKAERGEARNRVFASVTAAAAEQLAMNSGRAPGRSGNARTARSAAGRAAEKPADKKPVTKSDKA
jgi:hypothetical protein